MSYNVTKVTKRNGQLEEFDVAKITKVINFAARGLDVSVSQIELNAKIQLFNGVSTSDIHDTLIKSAADLISEENPDYQYMAARLAIYQMRKQAYGDYTPPHLLDHVKNLVEKKRYTPDLLVQYSEEEYNELNDYLDHDRDNNIAYAGVKQIIGKYAVKDKAKETQWALETPQMIFMLVGMCLFSDYDKKYSKAERMKRVKTFYDLVSTHKIALPTPIIAGVRTLTKQFSSCVKISTGDSLDSINASSNAIVKYIAQRAGIGLNIGRIRAVGSVIRNGEATHTGIFPFVKLFESAVGSCNQGKQHCPA